MTFHLVKWTNYLDGRQDCFKAFTSKTEAGRFIKGFDRNDSNVIINAPIKHVVKNRIDLINFLNDLGEE